MGKKSKKWKKYEHDPFEQASFGFSAYSAATGTHTSFGNYVAGAVQHSKAAKVGAVVAKGVALGAVSKVVVPLALGYLAVKQVVRWIDDED
jgi:hypothetical protein